MVRARVILGAVQKRQEGGSRISNIWEVTDRVRIVRDMKLDVPGCELRQAKCLLP